MGSETLELCFFRTKNLIKSGVINGSEQFLAPKTRMYSDIVVKIIPLRNRVVFVIVDEVVFEIVSIM